MEQEKQSLLLLKNHFQRVTELPHLHGGILMVKVLLKDNNQEIVETGEQIAKFQLDWTLFRLLKLSNKLSKFKLNIGYT